MGLNYNPLILPLDGMDREQALRISAQVQDRVGFVKVNDLLDGFGVQIVKDLASTGVKVMADPKLPDIPNTNANRAMWYRGCAHMLTVHASTGGIPSMRAVVDTCDGFDLDVLAVTALTSMSEEEIHLTYGQPSKAAVLKFARDAKLACVNGIVCSPLELKILKAAAELQGLFYVTPGIRPDWHQKADDQRRTMTPGEAIKAGAKYLVIGRPFLEASNIIDAIDRTHEEIELALAA